MELIAFIIALTLWLILTVLSFRFWPLALIAMAIGMLAGISLANDGQFTYTTLGCTGSTCTPQTITVPIDRTISVLFVLSAVLFPTLIVVGGERR